MARDEGLPDGWLNDAVKSFLGGPDEAAAVALDLPGLRVSTASARALLALKVLAHRVGEDEEDVRLLARELHLSTADEVLAVQRRRLAIGSSRLPASSSRSCSRDAARHPRRGRGVPVCPDHEPAVPEPRLKGPDTSDVIQPP